MSLRWVWPRSWSSRFSRRSTRSTSRASRFFLVEQNANVALSIADRGYVIQTGRIVMHDSAEALLANPELSKAYLGELEG